MLCPFCQEEIQDGAARCPRCHASAAPQSRPGPAYDPSRSFFAAGNLGYTLLSCTGRLNRAKYWAALAVLGAAQLAAVALSWELFVLAWIAAAYPSLAVGVKRFHDLDKSGYWLWFFLVPLLNIYAAVLVLFVRGTRGPNRFGPDLLR